jgi:hypothetical protein
MAQHDHPSALLDRTTAARILGVRPSTLRKWWSSSPARGPRGVKLSPARSARVLYPASEVAAFARDPIRYARNVRPDSLPAYEPPQRRGGRQHGREATS